MAKRIAASELNDRNWDEEEEEERAGQFVAANKNILKQRTIIKAKRRGQATISPGGGLFSSFAGFTSTPVSRTAVVTNNDAGKQLSVDSSSSSAGSKSATKEPTTTASALVSHVSSSDGISSSSSNNNGHTGAGNSGNSDTKFHSELKRLNESVLKWMQQHVAKDPYCILTPIFNDYNDHLKTIRDKQVSTKGDSFDPKTTQSDTDHKNGTSSAFGLFSGSHTTAEKKETSSEPAKTTGWSPFAISNSVFSSAGSTSLPATTKSPPAFSGFNFKTTDTQSTFSFAASVAASNAAAATGGGGTEEEEYEPPKVDVKEIKEEGSVYNKRCKLFYEKDKAWVDKGVGNLYVKPFKDKAQLIIRADTNLGNILLNIMLPPTMQLKRQGKNNVSLVCVPNPPLSKDSDNTKPIPMLLRVKTGEEADELLAELNKHKQGTDVEADVE